MDNVDLGARKRATTSSAITIVELAEKLGLSKSTVSRALSDYPDISPRTKTRVVEAAARYGYRPSSFAQSLKTGLMKSVALILSVSRDTVQQESLAEFLDGLSSALGQKQWTLTVATAADAQSDTDLQRRLIEEKKVDGFVIPRLRHDDQRVALMKSAQVPFVVYGRPFSDSEDPFYDIRSEACMEQAVARLHGHGHQRIAYIGPNLEYTMSAIRKSGYMSGLKACGLPLDAALMRDGAMSKTDGEARARDLLKLPEPPTAIVCGMDAAALGVYAAAQALNLRIGQHVSVIGYDGISEGDFVSPGLTTYASDSRLAGEALAQLLMRRIHGETPAELQVLADAKLVVRESDGAPIWSSTELAAHVAEQ